MTSEQEDDPRLYADTIKRCLDVGPPFYVVAYAAWEPKWTVTPLMKAKAARRYLASRHRTQRLGRPDGRITLQRRLLSPALIAGLDVPSDEAEVLLALAPAALVDLLPRLAAQGRERMATDPEAGTPTGRPFRPPERPKPRPEAESGPAPALEPEAPKAEPPAPGIAP